MSESVGQKTVILLIEDDPDHANMIREHLESIDSLPFELHATDDVDQAWSMLTSNAKINVILLDYQLGQSNGLDGLDMLRSIRERGDQRPVIVLTAHGNEYIAAQMIRAGADEYIVKLDLTPELLGNTIVRLLEHYRINKITQDQCVQVTARLNSLTPREDEVLDLILAGLINREIAEKLERSEKTIKIHRANIMQKMQASTPADLVRMVLLVAPKRGHIWNGDAASESSDSRELDLT